MQLVEQAFRGAISLGVAHLTAEDQRLDGRLITLNGRRRVNFSSCSYLGLETDIRLKNAACDAIERYGVQFSSSRAYVSCPPYRQLEQLLGEIFAAPVVVAPTTTLGHLAALPVLIGARDAVICDQLAHSSLQGVLPLLAASGTTCRLVRHSRVDRLDEMAATLARSHRRVFYLADGIYSMHGDVAPMAALRDLLQRHPRLHLYIDDAHGFGWSGRRGRGTVLGDGPPPPRTVVAVSMSKSFACGGAALVFPDAESARLVRTCGSTMIFSGPLQPALLGAAIASARIHLSKSLEARQQRLRDRIELFNNLARQNGLTLGSEDATPIRFLLIGDELRAYRMVQALMQEGYYTNAAGFPAVSRGRAGVRATLTVHQTPDDIRGLVETFARLR